MKPIKAIKDFELNGIFYEKNDEVEVNNIIDLVRLNEKGFISPLTPKELQNYRKSYEKGGIKEDGTVI